MDYNQFLYSPIDKMIQRVTDLAETLGLYAPIVYGSDPPENGICMIQNAGYPAETHLDKGYVFQLPVLLNGKHVDQYTVLGTLTSIHKLLTKRLDYADLSDEQIQVINIETTSLPAIIGREQNNQWICGSSFNISFYWR